MRYRDADLDAIQLRFGVLLPSSFRDVITSLDLSRILPWTFLLPPDWFLANHDERFRGPTSLSCAETNPRPLALLAAE